MRYFYLYFFLLLAWLAGCSPKGAMHRQNVSYRYAPQAAMAMEYVAEGDSLHFYLQLKDEKVFTRATAENYKLRYALYPDYETAASIFHDSIPDFAARLKNQEGVVYLDFRLPVARLRFPSLLIFRLWPVSAPSHVTTLDVPLQPEMLRKKFLLLHAGTGAPLFRNYINETEKLLVSYYGVPQPITARQFTSSFTAALPPMATQMVNVSPTMPQLQAQVFRDSDTLQLPKGLYLLDTGTSGMQGLLVEENSFPELTTAEELIQPLIYLTTSEERNTLYKAEDPKVAVDNFWLGIAGNKELGRQLIRTYYGRVSAANELFTSHKAGWLTDRGMIYIIFGQPDNVYRYNEHEEWIYKQTAIAGSAKFIFLKKPNNFTANHYELVRDPGYDLIWYSTVEQWRKGTIMR